MNLAHERLFVASKAPECIVAAAENVSGTGKHPTSYVNMPTPLVKMCADLLTDYTHPASQEFNSSTCCQFWHLYTTLDPATTLSMPCLCALSAACNVLNGCFHHDCNVGCCTQTTRPLGSCIISRCLVCVISTQVTKGQLVDRPASNVKL